MLAFSPIVSLPKSFQVHHFFKVLTADGDYRHKISKSLVFLSRNDDKMSTHVIKHSNVVFLVSSPSLEIVFYLFQQKVFYKISSTKRLTWCLVRKRLFDITVGTMRNVSQVRTHPGMNTSSLSAEKKNILHLVTVCVSLVEMRNEYRTTLVTTIKHLTFRFLIWGTSHTSQCRHRVVSFPVSKDGEK